MTEPDRIYRVLIVDDDEIDRRHYVRLLRRDAPETCVIVHAADGKSGLTILREGQFDCVLLDFNLPDMNGLQFLTNAMTDNEPPCAIVLVTGQGNEALAVKAMKLGVQDYLVKSSVAAGKLWDTIVRAVNQRELRLRLATSLSDLRAANIALEQEIAIRKATEVELRTSKKTAEEANQAKTRFVAMITHELRTPLNGILGYAQLLRMDGGLSDQQGTRVAAMIKAGKHLLEMIERVLDFASIESGRMEICPVPVAVRDLAEGCIGFIGPMATERGLGLRIVNAHDAPTEICTDPARLRQVLLNLLGNAVKFTTSGSIELRILAGVNGNLRLEVADTGPGINEIDRERLFQDFERLDVGISVEGAGLGLAISARVIALLGGMIAHKPNTSGGSVFWVELPPGDFAASAQISAAPPGLSHVPEQTLRTGLKVLVVDDVLINQEIADAFLRVGGHDVTCVSSGVEAIAAVASTDHDVVLMDVRMPEMDGLEATRRIRRLGAPRGLVPIIALTALAFTEQLAECRAAGMDGHLAKPFDLEALLAAVARGVESRPPRAVLPSPTLIAAGAVILAQEAQDSIFDRQAFDRTAGYLAPETTAVHLQTIVSAANVLLRDLRNLNAQMATDDELADAAHRLAGHAGLFGFARLATSALCFERAIKSGVLDKPVMAEELSIAIEATIRVISEYSAQPVESGQPGASITIPSAQLPRRRILIVEDDIPQQEILATALSSHGYEVEAVANGLDAIRAVRERGCDLMLVDYHIPEIDGLATARLARDLLGDAACPSIVALTASPDSLKARQANAQVAFNGIVAKPIRLSDLLSVVERCLSAAPPVATKLAAETALFERMWADYDADRTRPTDENGWLAPPLILVIEDDELQQSALRSALESQGYTVETATDGMQGIRMIRAGAYDLVLIDHQLPEMDGLAIARLTLDLMNDVVRPRMVAFTATPDWLRQIMTEAGGAFDDVVAKSSGLSELISVVTRQLQSAPNPVTRQATEIMRPGQHTSGDLPGAGGHQI